MQKKSVSNLFDKILSGLKKPTQPVVAEDDPLSKPKDWMTTAEIGEIFVGDGMKHNRILLKFAEIKTKELINKDKITPEEAASIVKKEWVRECRIVVSRMKLCASPKTIAELKEKEIIERKDKYLPKPKDCLSIDDMKNQYGGGAIKQRKILLDFAKEKVEKLTDAVTSEEMAKQIVLEQWVGIYNNGGKLGKFAFPQTITELERRGVLIKKVRPFAEQVGVKDISPAGEHINDPSGQNRGR